MRLNDKLIQGTIDGISGFIVARASARLGKSVEETQELFLASKTCALLNNKETGLYWDSILETLDSFLAEVRHPANRRRESGRGLPHSKTLARFSSVS